MQLIDNLMMFHYANIEDPNSALRLSFKNKIVRESFDGISDYYIGTVNR